MSWISFDYIYYRLYQFYFKWDGRLAATATLGVAFTQAMIIADCLLIPLRLNYSRPEIAPYSKTLAYCGVGILALLTWYNHRKYRKRIHALHKAWKYEHAPIKKKRGYLVVIFMILPLIPLIVMGVIK
jgi:hypothetical protein